VSKEIKPWIRGNISLVFGSEEIGRLERTEKRVSAATNPLEGDVNFRVTSEVNM
jgi:hypothetical protein